MFIASAGRTDGKAAVFVAQIGGGHGNLKRITPWEKLGTRSTARPTAPESPSARTSATPRSGNVFTVGVDGKGLRQLTHVTGGTINDGLDSWSPDGKKIAFVSNKTGRYEIYSMNADGTGLTQITQGSEAHLASWGSHP